MEARYLNNWSSYDEMIASFSGYDWRSERPIAPDMTGVEVLLASYGTPLYEGYAFVLFRKDGQLYEVNGSHCSCYGLEDLWRPEETSVESLRHRVQKGNFGAGDYDQNPFRDELLSVLSEIDAPEAQP